MQIISLRSSEKFAIKDNKGMDWMCHSLEGYNFLKILPDNYLLFDSTRKGHGTISI